MVRGSQRSLAGEMLSARHGLTLVLGSFLSAALCLSLLSLVGLTMVINQGTGDE